MRASRWSCDAWTGVLVDVLTRRLNAMRPKHVLVSYGLAAFLMETRPSEYAAFVKASAKRHDVPVYLREALGAPSVVALYKSLIRWLAEYRTP